VKEFPSAAERALELHATVPVVDLHGDVPQNTWPRRRAGEDAPLRDDWVRRWRQAGVDVEGLTVGGDTRSRWTAAAGPTFAAAR
jgi:hypothetical protein